MALWFKAIHNRPSPPIRHFNEDQVFGSAETPGHMRQAVAFNPVPDLLRKLLGHFVTIRIKDPSGFVMIKHVVILPMLGTFAEDMTGKHDRHLKVGTGIDALAGDGSRNCIQVRKIMAI